MHYQKNYIYLIEKKKQKINNKVQDLNKKTEMKKWNEILN